MSDRPSNPTPAAVRGMPRSDDAERGILSCFLQAPVELLEDAAVRMSPEWFYHAGNRLIFEELIHCHRNGVPVDLVALSQHFIDRGLMDKIGGPATLAELLNFVPTPAHYQHYTGILKDKLWLRSVIGTCVKCIEDAYDSEESDPRAALQRSIDALFEVQQAGQGQQRDFQPIGSYVQEALSFVQDALAARGHVTHGLATGFTDLDRRLMGLRKKQLIIIAGRPGMGKSALAMNIAECIVLATGHYEEYNQGALPVGFVTAEMSGFDLTLRSLMGLSGVHLGKCQTGMVSREEARNLSTFSGKLDKAPLFIFDTPAMSIQELHQKIKRAVAKHGLRLVIVDYLQLFKSATRAAAGNRQVEVGEVAQGLKAIAKDCDIPVIALAQIGRSAEERKGCKPQLADLRESGDIEAAADIVGAIYRPGYYERKKERDARGEEEPDDDTEDTLDNEAQLLLLKFRNGSTEPISLQWDGPLTQFRSHTKHLFSNNDAQREPAAVKAAPVKEKDKPKDKPKPAAAEPGLPNFSGAAMTEYEDREDYE